MADVQGALEESSQPLKQMSLQGRWMTLEVSASQIKHH